MAASVLSEGGRGPIIGHRGKREQIRQRIERVSFFTLEFVDTERSAGINASDAAAAALMSIHRRYLIQTSRLESSSKNNTCRNTANYRAITLFDILFGRIIELSAERILEILKFAWRFVELGTRSVLRVRN